MASNDFFRVVNLLRTRLENNTNVNTVLFSRTEQKDLYKKNIYPIAHINPVSAPFRNSAVSIFSFEVGVFDQRDLTDDIPLDKFEGSDDLQDNLNITYEILKDLVNYLRNSNNSDNIELDSVTDARPLLFDDLNILDGWLITITLKIPNGTVC